MKDPMLVPAAEDPRMVWIGYPDVAAPDRFAVPDETAEIIYVYVPLDVACRWQAAGPKDRRTLHLRFHPTPEDDRRLARVRERYSRRAAAALDMWDHTPKGRIGEL